MNKSVINWSNVIEKHETELKEALIKAFCDAVDHLDMEYSVEIYPDGTIRTTEHTAGSTFQSYDSWAGNSYIVGTFCFQNMDIEITEEMIQEHMTKTEISDAQNEAEEEGLSFMEYIFSSGKYNTIISDCENEYLEWYKDEYAYSEAREAVERNIEDEYDVEINAGWRKA